MAKGNSGNRGSASRTAGGRTASASNTAGGGRGSASSTAGNTAKPGGGKGK